MLTSGPTKRSHAAVPFSVSKIHLRLWVSVSGFSVIQYSLKFHIQVQGPLYQMLMLIHATKSWNFEWVAQFPVKWCNKQTNIHQQIHTHTHTHATCTSTLITVFVVTPALILLFCCLCCQLPVGGCCLKWAASSSVRVSPETTRATWTALGK